MTVTRGFRTAVSGRFKTTTLLAQTATVLALALGMAGCAWQPLKDLGKPAPDARPGVPGVLTGPPPLRLRLLNEVKIAHGHGFQGTTVGGLSGIDYDPDQRIWYLLSDDRSEHGPARFYTAQLIFSATRLERVELLTAVLIRRPDGTPYPKGAALELPAPEAIRFDPLTRTLLWTSEGERRPPRIVQNFVRKMSLDGRYQDQLQLPAMFTIVSEKRGPRNGLSFEGLTLSPSLRHVWIAQEDSLFQDGPVASVNQGSMVRFTQFDRSARSAVAQFAYRVEQIPYAPKPATEYADNGVSEILAMSDSNFLVLERSFAEGRGYAVRLFEASIEGATNVLEMQSLRNGDFHPMKKRLLLDFGKLGLAHVDNLEGMAWGPTLPNGNRTLVVVSDDNFNPAQVTQFLAFEVSQ